MFSVAPRSTFFFGGMAVGCFAVLWMLESLRDVEVR